MATRPQKQEMPFELIGGMDAVSAVVNRFYDLMDEEPRFRPLRDMHSADLGPMRTMLTAFLATWMGGPRDWFEKYPGRCVMSAHNRFAIGAVERDQWLDCMRQAMVETDVESGLADMLNEAFHRMAHAMQNR